MKFSAAQWRVAIGHLEDAAYERYQSEETANSGWHLRMLAAQIQALLDERSQLRARLRSLKRKV